MSKVKQLLMAAVLALPLLVTVPVSAVESSCTISNTGENSVNECTNENNYTCTVTNVNTVTVYNNGVQVAQSGNATAEDNQSEGEATTGSVTNSNGTTYVFTIENEGDEEVCMVSKVTVPEAPAPEVPAAGNGTAVVKAKPTVLANTSANDSALIALTLIAAGVVTVLGAKAYTAFASRR